MNNIEIKKMADLNKEQKLRAIELFVDGFGYVFSFSKDKDVLVNLFEYSLNPTLSYIALKENKVVGFMGIANNKIRPMHFEASKCIELFGKFKGTMIQKQLKAITEKPAVKGKKDIYIDYLTTDKEYRGQGIATQLIEFVCNELGYEECYLEVLSKNTTAKRLYEHIGFKEYKKEYNFFTLIQGLGYLIKLKKPIRKACYKE